jgi:hypothetical protein
MGTTQYGLDFTGPNNSITANLDFTAYGWTSTTGGVSADTAEGKVARRHRQRYRLIRHV